MSVPCWGRILSTCFAFSTSWDLSSISLVKGQSFCTESWVSRSLAEVPQSFHCHHRD